MSEQHDAESRRLAERGSCGNNCADALDRLWEYLDAELGALDAETVRAHLAECRGLPRGVRRRRRGEDHRAARLPGGRPGGAAADASTSS